MKEFYHELPRGKLLWRGHPENNVDEVNKREYDVLD